MVTRDQAIAHTPPFVGFLVAELVIGSAIIVGWNLWDRREQILDHLVRLVTVDST